MTRLRTLKLAVAVTSMTWGLFQAQQAPVNACNNFFCGNETQCGAPYACCLFNGGTGLNYCEVDWDGTSCLASVPCEDR